MLDVYENIVNCFVGKSVMWLYSLSGARMLEWLEILPHAEILVRTL